MLCYYRWPKGNFKRLEVCHRKIASIADLLKLCTDMDLASIPSCRRGAASISAIVVLAFMSQALMFRAKGLH